MQVLRWSSDWPRASAVLSCGVIEIDLDPWHLVVWRQRACWASFTRPVVLVLGFIHVRHGEELLSCLVARMFAKASFTSIHNSVYLPHESNHRPSSCPRKNDTSSDYGELHEETHPYLPLTALHHQSSKRRSLARVSRAPRICRSVTRQSR